MLWRVVGCGRWSRGMGRVLAVLIPLAVSSVACGALPLSSGTMPGALCLPASAAPAHGTRKGVETGGASEPGRTGSCSQEFDREGDRDSFTDAVVLFDTPASAGAKYEELRRILGQPPGSARLLPIHLGDRSALFEQPGEPPDPPVGYAVVWQQFNVVSVMLFAFLGQGQGQANGGSANRSLMEHMAAVQAQRIAGAEAVRINLPHPKL